MIGWIIGILVGLVLLIVIIRRINTEDDEDDVWSMARGIGRGACKKIKNLFGC